MPAGQIASVADNNNDTWTYGYNLLGQKISATDPGTVGSSGPSGNAGPTTFAYDGDGNLTSTTDPAGNLATSTYDALATRARLLAAAVQVLAEGFDGIH